MSNKTPETSLVKLLANHALDAFTAGLYEQHTQGEPRQPTAEEIVAKFYMRRGRNKKLTLRQHIKETETSLSEGYIRKVKVAYDKRHKRGKIG